MGVKTLPESKCPELLANYCDMLLRKTALSKKLTSEEVERKLREVVRSAYSAVCFSSYVADAHVCNILFESYYT